MAMCESGSSNMLVLFSAHSHFPCLNLGFVICVYPCDFVCECDYVHEKQAHSSTNHQIRNGTPSLLSR